MWCGVCVFVCVCVCTCAFARARAGARVCVLVLMYVCSRTVYTSDDFRILSFGEYISSNRTPGPSMSYMYIGNIVLGLLRILNALRLSLSALLFYIIIIIGIIISSSLI